MKQKYTKKCMSCGHHFSTNYQRSNPCAKCGGIIRITHIDGQPVARKKKKRKPAKLASTEKPKIKRTVTEEWKGDKYTKNTINGGEILTRQSELRTLINNRDALNERIKKLRYQFAWHKKRLEKGAFD